VHLYKVMLREGIRKRKGRRRARKRRRRREE
jgi:hypothetical protein